MSEEIIKHIYHISEKYGGEKIDIVTNHLKIVGKICKCADRDKSNHLLTLMNAEIYMLDQLCKCGEENCNCSAGKVCCTDWLDVNVGKIIAFSIIKE